MAQVQKRDSGTGASCDFCEIYKNTFFTEHLWTTASGLATHRPTDAVIMFKRLENINIYTLQNMT